MKTSDRLRRRPAANTSSMMANDPFRWAFIATLGVMLAMLLAATVTNLHQVLLSVFIAAFIALGLEPTIQFFERRGMKRGVAILTVIMMLVVVVAGIIWMVVPPIISQAGELVQNLPKDANSLTSQDWFMNLDAKTNGLLLNIVNDVTKGFADPNTWASVSGGALKIGLSIIDGVSTSIFVFVLTIYFIASLDTIKMWSYKLVNKSKRDSVQLYGDQILGSIGTYLSGMATLAFINAVFSTILLVLVGVKYAFLLGVLILFITMIPLVGTVITATMMTIISLVAVSPTAALIVGITMLIYMQVEAYVLTPKVMSKAVQIPGSVVLISALAGGTLLGLLGALVAIPISAGILLILKQVVIPERDLH